MIRGIALAGALCVGCASGTMTDGGLDGSPRDTGRRDTGVADGDPPDTAVPDAGPGCATVTCEDPFEYCDDGVCREYPACRGDGTCDRPLDVCHARRCVPGDVDIDGDGSPAVEDCDETNPEIYPGREEICNMIDDNCNMMIDEGDSAEICEFYPGGGICIDGNCGCPPGTFDLDRDVAGCECVAEPTIDQGNACNAPIDLGDVPDNGATMTLTGNVMPDDREVWYRFRGVDSVDTSCDNYHVRVRLLENPDGLFEFAVFRGSCSAEECGSDTALDDYSWATDFRATVASRLTGQCPCDSTPPLTANVSRCENDTAEYFVRVRRTAGAALSCLSYSLEISNGVYDTM